MYSSNPVTRKPDQWLTSHLATYLNDHLAGAVAAVRLLESLADVYAELRSAIVGSARGYRSRPVRSSGANGVNSISAKANARGIGGWLAEQATALKMRLDDSADGSLRLFESLEFLSLGIAGKLGLWEALKAVAEVSPAATLRRL